MRFKKIIAFVLIFAIAAVLCSCEKLFPSGQSGDGDGDVPAAAEAIIEEQGMSEDGAWEVVKEEIFLPPEK